MLCRNFTKIWSGIIGALITKCNNKNTYDACLIFTQGMIYDPVDKQYKVCLHRLKAGIGYKSVLHNYRNDEFIKSSFHVQEAYPVTSTKIIYVNVLENTSELTSQAKESSIFTPDHLNFNYDPSMNYIKCTLSSQ